MFTFSDDSQCDDVSVGCFHGDGQWVLSSLVYSVLIGSSLQQQTHLSTTANENQRRLFMLNLNRCVCVCVCVCVVTRCVQRWRQRAAPPGLAGLGG